MGALAINTANFARSAQGQTTIGTAGATITAGQPLYYDSTNVQYKPANSVAASPQYIVAGVAGASANVGQDIVVVTRDPNMSPGYTINAGNISILGNVAGQVNDVADRASTWFVTVLGVGIGGNRVNFQLAGANVGM